jgi:hypothetical protein
MKTHDNAPLSFAGIDPSEWMRAWQSFFRTGPLTQSILPGWTFNINSSNSSAPETESDIVARHSYGRQLGRISDALELLVTERHGRIPTDGRFTDFLAMKREIDAIKRDAAAARVKQLGSDLDLLKASGDKRYAPLRDALREALAR